MYAVTGIGFHIWWRIFRAECRLQSAQHDAMRCNVSRSGVRLMFNFSLHCKVFYHQLCDDIVSCILRNRFYFLFYYANWFCWFINLLFQWPNSVADTFFFCFLSNVRFFRDEKFEWQLNWFVYVVIYFSTNELRQKPLNNIIFLLCVANVNFKERK